MKFSRKQINLFLMLIGAWLLITGISRINYNPTSRAWHINRELEVPMRIWGFILLVSSSIGLSNRFKKQTETICNVVLALLGILGIYISSTYLTKGVQARIAKWDTISPNSIRAVVEVHNSSHKPISARLDLVVSSTRQKVESGEAIKLEEPLAHETFDVQLASDSTENVERHIKHLPDTKRIHMTVSVISTSGK